MALLRSLKIEAKLGLGFGLLLLITVSITVLGIINIWMVDADYAYTLNLPLRRYSYMRDLETELLDVRRIASKGAYRMGDVAAIDELKVELNVNQAEISGILQRFVVSFDGDETIGEDMLYLQLRQAENLKYLIDEYLTGIVAPGLQAAAQGDRARIDGYFVRAFELFYEIYGQFDELYANIRGHIESRAEQNSRIAAATMVLLGVSGGASLLLGGVVAVIITKAIAAQSMFETLRNKQQNLTTVEAAMKREREANEMTNVIFENSPVLIEIWDSERNFIDCNRRMLDTFGVSCKEEYLERYMEFIPETQPCGKNSFVKGDEETEKAFREGGNRYEWTRRLPNGEPLPVEVVSFCVERGGKRLLISYNHDLRPIKATLEKTRELEINERVRLMFDSAPLIIEYWDRKYNPIDCNKTAVDFYGFADKDEYRSKIVDTTTYDHPDCGIPIWNLWNEQLKIAFETGFINFDFTETIPSGDVVHMRVEAVRLKYNDEFIVVTYSNNVTKLKETELIVEQANNALKQRERLLDTTNEIAETLLAADVDGTFRALMAGMQLVGRCLNADRVQIWHNEAVTGEPLFVLRFNWLSDVGKLKKTTPIGDPNPCASGPEWLEKFERGEYVDDTCAKLSDDAVSAVALPLFEGQELKGLFSVDDCVNKRKFSDDEMDMLASAGLMFASVFNRNRQAEKIAETNKQLEATLHRALSASRAKSNFLSTMSHEMRTPMNAIIGMTAIARKETDIERKDYAVTQVQQAAHHLLGIINDILDMSRIEADKLELQNVPLDLRALLQKAVSFIDFRVQEKRHIFSMEIGNDVPNNYMGDDQRLTQVLTNLLTNAAIYTPEEGEIGLEVALLCDEGGVCELQFAVTDTGIGVSSEHQERLFHMFEQVDSGASRKYGGTGLGLPISKRLVELMGGVLTVESERGKGSRFVFTVKLKRAAGAVVNRTPHLSENNGGGVPQFPGKRLLLAEDVEINSEILISLLDGTELTIDVAKNGREAVNMVEQNPCLYDLVFMDVQMPEMDGLEATRRIRTLPVHSAKKLPIIAMTANVFSDDIEHCLAVGMNDHIGKPLDLDVILEKLQRWLGRSE